MIVLGIDTATTATAVGLRLPDGSVLERRDDPRAGSHPGHATRLLAMAEELLRTSDTAWSALGRVAVGLGPGSFTGLRVGVATAHGIACARSLELVGVSSLRALALAGLAPGGDDGKAAGAGSGGGGPGAVLAVIDARRGEVFAAAYGLGEDGLPCELCAPAAVAPERLPALVARVQGELESGSEHAGADRLGWRILGDGAVRYAEQLAAGGLAVESPDSPLHRVAAAAICELGARAEPPVRAGEVLPEYLRRPDAELALEGAPGA
jgi:tRNA threonylcarbamoyladenosine biosynthesis protein TsaB